MDWIGAYAAPFLGNVPPTTAAVRFRYLFGVPPEVCTLLYRQIADVVVFVHGERGFKPKHLLWGLYFLRAYNAEIPMATFCQTSHATFRKWSVIVVTQISALCIKYVS